MTENSPEGPGSGTQHSGPRVSGEQMRDLGRLRRSVTDRKLAGVAGGLARHLDVDPVLLRVAFVILAFFGGAGLLLYVAAWLLVPEDGQNEAAISSSPSTRTTALIVVAAIAGLLVIGDGWGGFGFPWPLLVVGLIVAVVLASKDKQTPSGRQQQPPHPETDGPPVSTTPSQPGAPVATWSDLPEAEPLPWEVPAPDQPVTPPRNRGPRLFWPTLALVAIVLGGLGIYEGAGGSVADSAYPALALAVVGLMLTIGAWFGRTGGLIFLGVVAAVSLALSGLASSLALGTDEHTPTSAAQLEPTYSMAAGRLDVDLTEIGPDALDGEQVDVEMGAGQVIVTVPDEVAVDLSAEIAGGGELIIDGERVGGDSPDVTDVLGPEETTAPRLDLDIRAAFGRIEVRTQ